MRYLESRKTLLMLAATCVLFTAHCLLAADAVTGKWKCIAKGLPDGDMEFTLELSQSGESLTGTISAENGSVEISNAKIHGNKFEFAVMTSDAQYTVTGSVEGNKVDGDWKDDQQHSGTWSGQKEE
ncbi:MAG TPA: hypothetical protein VMW38_27600 [Terriglobia bacterium]|nr:hypothetical protein [Terriglobia bacterium]